MIYYLTDIKLTVTVFGVLTKFTLIQEYINKMFTCKHFK